MTPPRASRGKECFNVDSRQSAGEGFLITTSVCFFYKLDALLPLAISRSQSSSNPAPVRFFTGTGGATVSSCHATFPAKKISFSEYLSLWIVAFGRES